MGTHKSTLTILQDEKIPVKIKLSALWVTLMLFYIYADILGFYSPGIIEKVMSGEVGGVQITGGFLLVMAVWMAVPSLMDLLSLTLKAAVNRWVNIVVGLLSMLVLGATFFAGDLSARYSFQAVMEAALMVSIMWQAWKWPQEAA